MGWPFFWAQNSSTHTVLPGKYHIAIMTATTNRYCIYASSILQLRKMSWQTRPIAAARRQRLDGIVHGLEFIEDLEGIQGGEVVEMGFLKFFAHRIQGR